MFQDKNRVLAPPLTPKGQGGGQFRNLMIIYLKFFEKQYKFKNQSQNKSRA
jgi:hypothetical protein